MAVPKKKTSKARTRRRRSINMRQSLPTVHSCPSCGNEVLRHRVCPKCGNYRSMDVLGLE